MLSLLAVLGYVADAKDPRPARQVGQDQINAGNVLTQHNDVSRSGVQSDETTLTPAAINLDSFGPLYSRDVDGMISAQPLYVNGVGGDPNKKYVFIATTENYVYAFDTAVEDANPVNRWMWRTRLAPPIARQEFPGGNTFLDGALNVGILATPVIAPQTSTMYLLGTDASLPARRWRLFALDIATGEFKYPAQPAVTAAGTVQGEVGTFPGTTSNIPFAPLRHVGRPGLLVLGDGATTRIYAAFGSFADTSPFHGWVFKFIDNNCTPRATCSGLSLSALYCTTPFERSDGGRPDQPEGGGGIWQSGGGLVGDPVGLKVLLVTGNGISRNPNGPPPAGPLGPNSTESAVVVLDALSLGLVAKWHPPNFGVLQKADMDFGSGGPLLLPGGPGNAGRVVAGGKNGVFYVLRRDLASGDVSGATGPTQAWQAFVNIHLPSRVPKPVPCTPGSRVMCNTAWDEDQFAAPNIHGTPVYFEGAGFKRMYAWSEKDHLKAWDYDGASGTFNVNPKSALDATLNGMPGGFLAISASGSDNGVVWATTPETNPQRCGTDGLFPPGAAGGTLPNHACDTVWRRKPGRLYAFDASTLRKLWDGYVPGFAKFTVPTVANGRVYVPTSSNRFVAYGLRAQPVSTWRALAGPTNASGGFWPAVASWGGNRLDVLARGTDDALHHRSWVSGTWVPAADWEPQGGILRSSPSVVAWGPDRLDVVVKDLNDNLKWKWYAAGAGWSGWEVGPPVGRSFRMASEPVIVSWGPGRADVFAINSAGALNHSALVNGAWTAWEVHANCCGFTVRPQSRLSVVVTTDVGTVVNGVRQWTTGKSIHLLARGSTDQLLYKRWTPKWGWEPGLNGGWMSLGGLLTSDPGAVSRGDKLLDVFVRNADGELSRRSALNASSDISASQIAWTGWEDRWGVVGSKPEFAWMATGADGPPGQYSRPLVLSDGAGAMTLYVKGGDSVVHRIQYTGAYWTLWEKIRGGAGGSDSEPIGVRILSDHLLLVKNGTMYHVEPPATSPR